MVLWELSPSVRAATTLRPRSSAPSTCHHHHPLPAGFGSRHHQIFAQVRASGLEGHRDLQGQGYPSKKERREVGWEGGRALQSLGGGVRSCCWGGHTG